MRPHGHALVATFDADGPEKCRGLEVARYSPESLRAQFGSAIHLIRSVHETPVTPWGATQRFIYGLCSVEGGHGPLRPRRRPGGEPGCAPARWFGATSHKTPSVMVHLRQMGAAMIVASEPQPVQVTYVRYQPKETP